MYKQTYIYIYIYIYINIRYSRKRKKHSENVTTFVFINSIFYNTVLHSQLHKCIILYS